MLAVMAADWRELVYRASIALLFGIAVLSAPQSRFVLLFVLYTLADGIAALVLAYRVRWHIGFGSALLDGLARVAAACPPLRPASPPALGGWQLLSGGGR